MRAGLADAEGFRRVERRRRDQHRGEADQRVEGGDELRHRRHRRCDRAMIGADAAADGEAEDDQAERRPSPARRRASVVTMAIAMPAMPRVLPWRDVSGFDRPRSARMKRTPATR